MTSDIKENMNRFLVELYLLTKGDTSIMVSMYDVGESLGLDRNDALRTAEELIGTGLVEIITLNGGISITADGIDEAHQMGAAVAEETQADLSLGDKPVLDETRCGGVAHITNELKHRLGDKGLSFDPLAEILADLKSIDAQLSSPNPKTAIVRECLQSIRGVLKTAGDTDGLSLVEALLGK